MDVRMFTVGPVAENTYIFRRDGSDRALIVDPGDEADKLLGAIDALGREARRHPAHAHALRPRGRRGAGGEGHRRRGLGAEDRGRRARRHHELRAVARLRPVRVLRRRAHARGRRAARARRLRDRRAVHARPQPRPRDLLDPGRAGDLLRATCSSSSRSAAPTCPGGDYGTLLESIRTLVDTLPEETAVYPGHMGTTTLGAERATNPFLAELAAAVTEAPGAAGHARRAARGRAPPARARPRSRTRCSAAPGYEPFETPVVRGHRGVRARGGGVHRHRPEGDVHLRGQGRPLAHAAPRGHGRRSAAPTSSTACTSCPQPVKVW